MFDFPRHLLPNWNREILRFSVVSWILAFSLGSLLPYVPAWRAMELKTFDWFSVISAPRKSLLPITIVGIDDASFTQLGLRWPWPRDMHAELVRRLSERGAAVIAFDILFAESASPAEDAAFSDAIRKSGNIVLASDHSFHETASIRQWLRLDPIPQFTEAGAVAGIATVELDSDTVSRRIPLHKDAFWRQTIDTFIRMRPGVLEKPFVPDGSLFRHLGPAHTFPYVSYYQVLQEGNEIPPDFFADQIVLVGRDIRSTTETMGTQSDTFATPFLSEGRLLTPGVEIHATAIENALLGNSVNPGTPWQNLIALVIVMILIAPAVLFWSPLRSLSIAFAILCGFSLGSYYLFVQHNLWLATAAPAAAIMLSMLSMTGFSYYSEKQRAQQIRGAFSLYVSPAVVEQMIAQPERLRLGGERRELSLLFCDLAGFTSMSERLSPDAVANVINLYLNEMTHIIMRHGGTVDKFIGDAIMAFWGAPLDDAEHALHATLAAIEMQAKMAALQPDFEAKGAGHPRLRIGLHSGAAIVGNMGSNQRFDYTALGDNVNLASRLEGANKAYDTAILLSASTRTLLPPEFPVRRIDRVRVKGKDNPVDIYTPCEDTCLNQATEIAWKNYTARRWDVARTNWSNILSQWPADSLPRLFIERIDAFQSSGLQEDWDGATALDKL